MIERPCQIWLFRPGAVVQLTDDQVEWDYGDCEGRRTADIRKERPGCSWSGNVPNVETAEQAGQRTDKVLDRATGVDGDVALFALGAAPVGLFGFEHDDHVIRY